MKQRGLKREKIQQRQFKKIQREWKGKADEFWQGISYYPYVPIGIMCAIFINSSSVMNSIPALSRGRSKTKITCKHSTKARTITALCRLGLALKQTSGEALAYGLLRKFRRPCVGLCNIIAFNITMVIFQAVYIYITSSKCACKLPQPLGATVTHPSHPRERDASVPLCKTLPLTSDYLILVIFKT